MATWSNEAQSSSPDWLTEDVSTEFDKGEAIGLLLTLTYVPGVQSNIWSNISQSVAPSWANVTEN